MKLYFDTNVYSMIAECDEATSVRKMLQVNEAKVLASCMNLSEIWAIPDSSLRRKEMSVLCSLASAYPQYPLAYLHAQEVLWELRRLRPSWVRVFAFDKSVKWFLKAYREEWKNARKGVIPSPVVLQSHRRDAEGGIKTSRANQKFLRNINQAKAPVLELNFLENGQSVRSKKVDLKDPDETWRRECLCVWENAIVKRDPASRDYADYLCPYITQEAFADIESSFLFWAEEVDSSRVQRNRLCGLVHHFQLGHKISHGNSGDLIHANHLLDVDMFFTADKAFFNVLNEVSRNLGLSTRVILISRETKNALSQVEAAM